VAGTTEAGVDIVLVGLPGSGKTAVGAALAKHLGAAFVDTDTEVERATGRSIQEVFASEGEAAFRALDRAVVASLGPPDAGPGVRRVIATGGGTVVDPRNRWALYRDHLVAWLDAPMDLLAARLAGSPAVRPLLAGAPTAEGLARLAVERGRFYAAAQRVDAAGPAEAVVEAVAALARRASTRPGGTLVRADLAIGALVLGDGIAGDAVSAQLRALGARRAIILSEPGAWRAVGGAVAAGIADRGWPVEPVLLPEGEAAKQLGAVEAATRRLAALGVERDEPLVAIGGGALTDAAGFVAATWLRGVPWIALPTTLLGQLDAAIGGKTAVDLPEGKNLVGAFHQPAAVIADVALLAGLPERHRRAALAEAVKDGVLGEPRLLEVLEADGPAIAAGTTTTEPGALAEVVERAAWYKVRVVTGDTREQGDRIALNLGHSLGHAFEAAGGYGTLLHGEAIAYGLRAACLIGAARGVTPAERADRIEGLLDRLDLGVAPLPWSIDTVLGLLARDKKHHGGRLRWVLPTADGWALDDAVPDAIVRVATASVLAGRAP
jgi:shikimate kinase / 3-dehydroquinate synthase